VAAQVAGVVAAIPRRVGDWVKAGDAVIQLDESQLRIALANGQAALDTARINLQAVQDSTAQNSTKLELQLRSAQAARDSAQKFYDSQKALFDLGGISASALDTAGSQLASAQASLETARVALDQNQRGLATTPSQNVEVLKIAITTAQNNLEQARLNLRNAPPSAGRSPRSTWRRACT
jgi:membrane fusion protein (multidrug efflux system)